MTALKMAIVAVVASFMLALGVVEPASAQVPSTQQSLFTGGFLPVNGGLGLLVFVPGGNMVRLAGAAQIEGCTIEAAWRSTPSGQFATYIFRAPAFVNDSFVQELPNGELPPNSPLMLRCAKPAAPAQTRGSDTAFVCSKDFPEVVRQKVLTRLPVRPSVCAFRYKDEAEARAAGAILPDIVYQSPRRGGASGYHNGRFISLIGGPPAFVEAHELGHEWQFWLTFLEGVPVQWEKTQADAEFRRIGNWQYNATTKTWTSQGLEGIGYTTIPVNPFEAAAQVIAIILNPEGDRTQAEIDAIVPPAYQAWAYKWAIVR